MSPLASFEVRKALAAFAQNSQLFALLDAAGIHRFATIAKLEEIPAGATIVEQGQVGTSFYLIAHGEVRVLVEAGEPQPKEVARLGPGNFFGEIAVLTRQPRTATVECTEITTLICFEREPVLEILADYPKVKEVIGGVGLLRSEANIEDALGTGRGLADALEAPEDEGDEEGGEERNEDDDEGDEEADEGTDEEAGEPPELELDDLLADPAPAAPAQGDTLSEEDLFADDEAGGPDRSDDPT